MLDRITYSSFASGAGQSLRLADLLRAQPQSRSTVVDTDGPECGICSQHVAEVVYVPCGHCVLCVVCCADQWLRSSERSQLCLICRAPVLGMRRAQGANKVSETCQQKNHVI